MNNARMIAIVWLFVSLARVFAGGPTLEGGLSVRMLPDRAGEQFGFTVTAPPAKDIGHTYKTAKELFAYMRNQTVSERLNIPRNGVWVSAEEPSSYSTSAVTEFNSLITYCTRKKIPIHLHRPSDIQWRPALPNLRQKP